MSVITNFEINSGYEITQQLNRIYSENKIPVKVKYREGHIFNEDMSVRWNKEEVGRQNEMIDKERRVAWEVRNQSLTNLHNAVIDYIISCFRLSRKEISVEVAQKIVAYCKNAFGDDNWANELDDLIDFVENII